MEYEGFRSRRIRICLPWRMMRRRRFGRGGGGGVIRVARNFGGGFAGA